MSKDKYPSIFLPQMETTVFIILQIFFATCAILKIGGYSQISPSFSWGIFSHVMCLDQSLASEKIWWIVRLDAGQVLFLHVYGLRKRAINLQKKIRPANIQRSWASSLRWLKTVSSTFQDAAFDGQLLRLFISWCYNHGIKKTAQSLVNTLVLFPWHNGLP